MTKKGIGTENNNEGLRVRAHDRSISTRGPFNEKKRKSTGGGSHAYCAP